MDKKMKQFELSFATGVGTMLYACRCGVTYYNENRLGDLDSEEMEELNRLISLNKTQMIQHEIWIIGFEGRQYADVCNCWHERATKIIEFIEGHGHAIAQYLNSDKRRMQEEADAAPTVNI